MKHSLKTFPYAQTAGEMEAWIRKFERELRETMDSLIAVVNVERTEKELIREQDELPIEEREQAVFDMGYCKGVFEKLKEILAVSE